MKAFFFVPTNHWLLPIAVAVAVVGVALAAVLAPPALLAVLTICFLLLVLSIRAPRYMLLALVLFRSGMDSLARQYRLMSDSALSVNLLGILNVALVVFAVFYFSILKRKIPRYPFVALYALLLYLAAVSFLISEDRALSLRGWMIVGSYIAIYAMVVSLFKTRRDLASLATTLALSSVIPMGVALHQFITDTGNTTISPGLNRVMGTLFHPSALGMYLVTLWPLLLFLAWHTRRRGARLLYLLLLAVATLLILATYTRVVWIVLLLCMFGALIVLKRFDLMLILGIGSVAIGVLYMGPILARFGEAIRFQHGQIVFSEFGSFAWRLGQWRRAIELFTARPLTGIGWWTFPLHNIYEATPHSDYLRVAAETGILGLACYVTLIASLLLWFARAYRHMPSDSSDARLVGLILVSILGFAVLNITDNPLGQPEVGWYFWTVVALGVNSARIALANRGILVEDQRPHE